MKIKILTPAITQSLPKKDGSGSYTKTTSEAVYEAPNLKFATNHEFRDQASALAPGDYICDIESQLQPGRYGLELPRYLKLTPAAKQG
jgi:hypothetical protein